jgi:2,3-bisphosphoglycerate-independent phosphoglycerate mutase
MDKKFKPVVLIIRDGWGENHNLDEDSCNAVKLATTPVADHLKSSCPNTEIEASGLAVGLPVGIMGNSEVGHQNIGAGRIVDQEIVRINKGIESGAIAESPALKKAFSNVQEKGSKLHLMGLVSDAGVHSMLDHLFGILLTAKAAGVTDVYLHAFTDGRDTSPFTGKGFIEAIEAFMEEHSIGKIATIMGRYWSMDRDNRWDRVQRAYEVLTGDNPEKVFNSAAEAIQYHYDNPEKPGMPGDEFCPPSLVLGADGEPLAGINDDDSVLFFNFRGDRPRELTRAFIDDAFEGFNRGAKKELFYVTMTEYQKGLCPNVIFLKPPQMDSILGAYVSEKNIPQFRCAETEKFPHVTFFFNDYREEPFPLEERALIQSPTDCATYDEKPEMSAYGVRDAALKAIKSQKYGLIVINFANPDMVGHTGVLEACIKACEIVDGCVGELLQAIDQVGGKALITADHGNSDKLWNEQSQSAHTAHTLNPVEVVIYGAETERFTLRETGCLGDIAPTLLQLMDLEKPTAMTGESLIQS